MKILLIGEYSGVHTELKNALYSAGHSVTLISDGDAYKNYKSDLLIKNNRNKGGNLFKRMLFLFYDFSGLAGLKTFLLSWRKLKKEFQGFDIIQLINPVALSGFGSIPNLILLRFLSKQNSKIFLCALGDDYYWVKECFKSDNKYEALKKINLFNFYKQPYSTKYTHGFFYKFLNNYAIGISEKIIPGLYDYKRVYSWSTKCTKLVPLPINAEKIGSTLKIKNNEKIVIFHGWQTGKELRKGNDLFDRVVKRLLLKYPNRISYKIVSNVTYEEYLKTFSSAHIALDQCYSYDKGMNGLLYMAAGKVAFTGMETETLKSYPVQSSDQIGVNTKKDEEYLYRELENLILNPDKIETISRSAIDFVQQNHSSEIVMEAYMKIWTSAE